MKRELAVCMSLVLGGTTILNPMVVEQIGAVEKGAFIKPAAQFSIGSMTAINAGAGAMLGDSDLINKIKQADDFTFNTKFKLTGTTAVESLFFIGDSTQSGNYVVIYMTPDKKIGIEARNGDTRTLNVSKDIEVKLNDGAEHTFTYTQKKGDKFKFYIDGNVVFEGASANAFCNGLIANADYIGIGNGKRNTSFGSYPFTGELGNVQIFDQAIPEDQILAYHQGILSDDEIAYTTRDHFFNENSTYSSLGDISASTLTGIDSGSVSIRYRAASADSGMMSLFSLSDSTKAGNYMSFYVNPSANSLGVKIAGTSAPIDLVMNNAVLTKVNKSVKNTAWHTLTVAKSNTSNADKANRYSFYLDGVKLDQYSNRANFFNNIPNADSVNIGFNKTTDDADAMKFIGAIDMVKVYNKVLSESDAKGDHSIAYVPGKVTDLTNAIKTEPESLYYPGYEGSAAYRIPSLLKTTSGTLLATIDKRNSGAGDAGNIDSFVRRKEAGSANWEDPIFAADLVDKNNGTPSAFLIDPAMVQDKETGRIFMLVDMFPESSGLMNPDILKTGSGYKKIDGVDYQIVNDASGNTYTIREDGNVYDVTNNKTAYRIITECAAPYKELGNIYKNGKYVGNMYIYSGSDKGELNAVRAQYLWLSHSDDDGKTWSLPKNITPQVKQDWMLFLGTGPGVGLQLQDGTLTFPVYSASRNLGGTQASAMIHSRDGGETWELGESPVKAEGNDRETMNGGILTESQAIQLKNGDVKLFMRNQSGKVKVATSHDGGSTWEKVEQIPVYDAYCQLSVTHYEKDGNEYIALLNPSGPGRKNGKVYLGEVSGSDISWTASKQINSGGFAYSSITALGLDEHGDMKFGALYEQDDATGITVDYTEFDENFVKAGMIDDTLKAPVLMDKTVEKIGDKLRITLSFDQMMMAAGDPILSLSVGDKTFDAHYVSGSSTSNLIFEATLDDSMFGLVKANGIDETNGFLENIINGKTDVAFDVLDLTETSIASVTATSQHSSSTAPNTDGAAVNVLDKNPNTYWHSTYGNASITLPQSLTLDLGEVKNIYKFAYLPRQNSQSGHVLNFELSVSETADGEYKKVYSGTFANTFEEQNVEFIPTNARYIKFTILTSTAGESTSVAEVRAFAYEDGLFGKTDQTALKSTIQQAQSLLENGDMYANPSKTKVREAITNAQALLGETASQKMIDDAQIKIKNAVKALIDIRPLQDAITAAEALNASQYTKETWSVFESALKEIKEAVNTITVNREVTDLMLRLEYENDQLVKVELDDNIAREVLGSAITKAQALNKDDLLINVNKKVVKHFRACLDEAVKVYADKNASNETLTKAWKDLADAMQYLDFTADLTHLEALVTEWTDADMSRYVDDENLAAFYAAKTYAQDVLANENSLDASLTEAFDRMTTAISNLKLKEDQYDTIVLDYMIAKSEAVMKDEIKYDTKATSWTTFMEAYKKAVAAKTDAASQDAIDTAASALASAYEDVRLIANEDTLQELKSYIAMIDEINMDEYGTETIAYFMNARAVFQRMVEQESYTMNEYENALNLAKNVEDKAANDKVDPAKPIQPSDSSKETNASAQSSAPVTNETPKTSNIVNGTTKPATGDTTRTGVAAGGMAMAGVAAVFAFLKRRKK